MVGDDVPPRLLIGAAEGPCARLDDRVHVCAADRLRREAAWTPPVAEQIDHW